LRRPVSLRLSQGKEEGKGESQQHQGVLLNREKKIVEKPVVTGKKRKKSHSNLAGGESSRSEKKEREVLF